LEGARRFVERNHPDRLKNGGSVTPGIRRYDKEIL